MASMRVTLVRSKKQNMYNRAYVNPESLELYREIRQNQRARCGAVGSEHGCALINDILAVQLQYPFLILVLLARLFGLCVRILCVLVSEKKDSSFAPLVPLPGRRGKLKDLLDGGGRV
uniref:Uncharacterized protein n=1 Tax=Rhizophora mucronata TaxID=61149 RepID=A0A2P2MAT5_RHIMU